jgi:S1-C subfamily serine protease
MSKPIKEVFTVIDRTNERAYLGIRPGEETEEGEGIVLAEVVGGGPAAQVGIQAGDRLLRVGEEEVKGSADLTARHLEREPLEEVLARLARGERARRARLERAVDRGRSRLRRSPARLPALQSEPGERDRHRDAEQ